ncbi:MAG: NUDIX hydrolase [Bacteroidetes bacterium]|nr:NUDIX hydrolase [Bacteroidota bacterium]
MRIKIYFDHKPLFLCDMIDGEIEPFVHHDDAVFIDELNLHTIKAMIHEMQLPKVHAGIFLHPDLAALKKSFWKKFTVVQAGGGFVINNKEEVLLIFRRGKWDLPKGKLDKGETLEQCAVREVQEETGLKKIKLISPLTITYHTYHEGTKFLLKESHWYMMTADAQEKAVPQAEEQIQEVKWVPPTEVKSYFSQTYSSVVEVLKAGALKLQP